MNISDRQKAEHSPADQRTSGPLLLSVNRPGGLLQFSPHLPAASRKAPLLKEKPFCPARRMVYWLEGITTLTELPDILYLLRSLTAQSLCLSISKTPKSAWEIAREIHANPGRVEALLASLLHTGAITAQDNGKYLLNFIAVTAADWRRLKELMREPARLAAVLLAKSESRLRLAFEKTPLALSGWHWQNVVWPLYGGLVALLGVERNLPAESRLAGSATNPPQAGYALGAYEINWGERPLWSTGCHGVQADDGLSLGCFWPPFKSEDKYRFDAKLVRVLETFAHHPQAEAAALAQLGGDASKVAGLIMELRAKGFLRAEGDLLRCAIPVLTSADSEILLGHIDRAVKPVIDRVLCPAFAQIDASLGELGYRRLQPQFHLWHRWTAARIMGEALRHLMQQGMLPHIAEPYPANFAFLAWEPGLAVMDLKSGREATKNST